MKNIVIVLLVAASIACENRSAKSVELSASNLHTTFPPPPPNEKIDSEIFYSADKIPHFPGGELAMRKYLNENIDYPEVAQKENVSGTVIVQFVVEKDGSISEPKVIKGISRECDLEALRVVKEMPKWEPAEKNNKAVSVYFNLPIVFKLT